jgi:hypothetical protein
MFSTLRRWQRRFISPVIASGFVSRDRVACSMNGLSALINEQLKRRHAYRAQYEYVNGGMNQEKMLTRWIFDQCICLYN